MENTGLELTYWSDFFSRQTVKKTRALPINSRENNRRFIFVVITILLFIIFLCIVSQESYFTIFVTILFVHAFVSILNYLRDGPAAIRIDKDGLSATRYFNGVLPWSAFASIMPQYRRDSTRPNAMTLVIKDRAALEAVMKKKRRLREFDGCVYFRIDLVFIENASLIAAATAAAAAKFASAYTWQPVMAGYIDDDDG